MRTAKKVYEPMFPKELARQVMADWKAYRDDKLEPTLTNQIEHDIHAKAKELGMSYQDVLCCAFLLASNETLMAQEHINTLNYPIFGAN